MTFPAVEPGTVTPGRASQEPTRTSYSPVDCVSAPQTLFLSPPLSLFLVHTFSLSLSLFVIIAILVLLAPLILDD